MSHIYFSKNIVIIKTEKHFFTVYQSTEKAALITVILELFTNLNYFEASVTITASRFKYFQSKNP